MNPRSFHDGKIVVHAGDCMEVLRELPDNSIDAVVTDPPYHLTSIVKRFGAANAAPAKGNEAFVRASRGFMGKVWDGGDIAFTPELWAQVLRVLKPGGHCVAFGGTRTYHRLACAIEDGGFEIRDALQWLYGSGFPKSHDVSKGIDKAAGAKRTERVGVKPGHEEFADRPGNGHLTHKDGNEGWQRPWQHGEDANDYHYQFAPATDAAHQWQGWGTALKPSFEPILYARKPFTSVPLADILLETENLIGVILCRLLFCASNAAWLSQLNLSASKEASGSALIIAAVLHGSQSVEWSEQMVMSSSPETAAICLSIAQSWNRICNAVSNQSSTFTTLTETVLTTALKTLNSCLLPIIPHCITKAASRPLGELLSADIADKSSSETPKPFLLTQEHIAHVAALCLRELNSANDAEASFMAAAQSANSVLNYALTELPTRSDENFAPNLSPVCLARKPLSEPTVAANVLRWGTGAINVDGCRIEAEQRPLIQSDRRLEHNTYGPGLGGSKAMGSISLGRFPANLILDGSPEVLAGFPKGRSAGDYPSESHGTGNGTTYLPTKPQGGLYSDSGSSARFFYTAKADANDRLNSKHPTVKPVDLIAWLVRLICPKNGTVLDPFAGTGTTGAATFREGCRAVLIEREAEYLADIERRMELLLSGPDERARKLAKADPHESLPLFGAV